MSKKKKIGVGLISVGWMGNLHTRAYQSLNHIYPELGVEAELVIAADTAEDRAKYAHEVLGYRESTTDYQSVLQTSYTKRWALQQQMLEKLFGLKNQWAAAQLKQLKLKMR
jgi:hypothetical protein